jgi:hypothetical protein
VLSTIPLTQYGLRIIKPDDVETNVNDGSSSPISNQCCVTGYDFKHVTQLKINGFRRVLFQGTPKCLRLQISSSIRLEYPYSNMTVHMVNQTRTMRYFNALKDSLIIIM